MKALVMKAFVFNSKFSRKLWINIPERELFTQLQVFSRSVHFYVIRISNSQYKQIKSCFAKSVKARSC